MGTVKQISEIIIDLGEERTDAAQAQYGNAVRPIYTQENERPDHEGTCVLVRTPEPILLTAAHVVDATHSTGTYVAGISKLIAISGIWITTKAPDTGRRNDAFDFAFMHLDSEAVEALGSENFIDIDDFEATADSPENRAYCCLGYPNSKNKKISPGHSIPTYCYRFWSTSAGCTNPKPGRLTDDAHILLKFDKKRVGTADCQHVNPPNLHGMSGGLMVNLFNARDPNELVPGKPAGKVAGLLIEYHEKAKSIVAVRSHVIRHALASWTASG